MNDTPCTYRISVKAIIKDTQGRILLVREANGNWELPGGGLEHGEEPHVGLAREIAEETGMTVEHVSEQPVGFWTLRRQSSLPALQWFAMVAYEVQASGDFRPDPAGIEAQAAGYFTAAEAQALQLHNNTQPFFAAAKIL
jgi:ADP-ribose pyrophosphatase YjhB (NUDIX family)